MNIAETTYNKTNSGRTKESMLFGDWLVANQRLSPEQLHAALLEQNKTGGRLGEVLVRLEAITEREVTQALGEYLKIETVLLEDVSAINIQVARLIPETIATRFCLVGIGEDQGKVLVAIADPLNVVAVDTITVKLKRPVRIMLATARDIQRAIEVIYHGTDVQEQKLRDLVELEVSTEEDEADLEETSSVAEAEDAPVIRFVDLLLSHAVKSRASDIHIEPQEKSMSIRMRVDGMLQDMVPPARKMQSAVVARIKILSEMDIAERRLPQDGRFKIKAGNREIDVRVSTLPTIYGEKVVMRILDAGAVEHNLDKMGFEPHLLDQFKRILSQPHGIIIVTGPTGSGKSTTLYSALNYLRDPKKNITTVEDPVEYRLGGINQTQVKAEIKLTFASCLRAILRQDPDIILLGEIRDKETMEIAMKASLTGHLVLSTFHTNDAPSAISRLVYMGLEPYLLASSLNLILAQRLLRRLCEHCRQPMAPDEDAIRRLRIDPKEIANTTVYQAKGCNQCNNTGYSGRVPIFEFLPIERAMRDRIAQGAGEVDIRAMAREKGYGNLTDSGVRRMMQGLTTAEEVLRVTFAEE
ncbi:MAG: Flp pilus assembly complex ATPase component TadA [Sedimentisphaerales bacterium]|nr:Flp pilus assembly complex ATPase component TadA [Sedimentisphaerales bacterium]